MYVCGAVCVCVQGCLSERGGAAKIKRCVVGYILPFPCTEEKRKMD